MGNRISGQSVDCDFDGELIHFDKISLDISDNTAAAQTRGVPDGSVSGDVSADGEVEFSSRVLKEQITPMAARAGSWRAIPEFDATWYAKAGDEELKVEAFGCKLVVTSLLDIDPKGGSTLTHKAKFFITSPEFIKINGVPYLSSDDVRNLIG
ncbi:DUF2597 family protein [Citrobacter portucalensis]|uniref:phage protein n=1 Tax=Citrobacter portucalensis TaxID=1639133 RepID=UPI00226BAF50|nr:phage protein [Citrobacter portucalensis]MCX9039269.1 DUF2597 family protein [Citrobacter portucalensis]MCX9061111.1 DUF2597 family protein [Citrobacter portucalensis]